MMAGEIAARLTELARRCGDLSPIADAVRQILVDGNRARAVAGVDAKGMTYAPLAPATLKRRKGSGPPLAPHEATSRIVTQYVVNVQAGPGRLSFTATWPSLRWVEYHVTGTVHMPRRDPTGFRAKDLEKIGALLSNYVNGGTPRRSVSQTR